MLPETFKDELELEKSLSWQDVFEIWRANEEHRANWKRIWKEKGFDSWEEWRMRYAEAFKLSEREWKLYFVKGPLMTVPKFRGGPFRGWVERFYEGQTMPIFEELAQHHQIQSHGGVIDIMRHFPDKTTVSGVLTDDGTVIVEGMHRCSAVALASQKHIGLNTHFTIALGSKLSGKLPVIGKFRKED